MLQIDNLKEGESIQVVMRRHWIAYVWLTIYALGGIIMSLILFYIFGGNFFNIIMNIVFGIYFLLFLYIEWLNQELDLYVITNNRIIGVEQISWMNRVTREFNLGQVQEVSSKMKGVIPNLLNYGTLSIQTAGANTNNLDMELCPDATHQKRIILNIVDEYRDNEVKGRAGMTGKKIHTNNNETEGKN